MIRIMGQVVQFKSIQLFLLLGLLGGVTGCSTEPKVEGERTEVKDLHLRYHPGGARIVTGRLVNLTEERISVAQIHITLFDGDNRAAGNLSVVVHDIPAGEGVAFREPVRVKEDIQGVRVKQVLLP